MRPLLALVLIASSVSAEDPTAGWILDLASEDAAVRDAAQARLLDAGDAVLQACEAALKNSTDLEQQTRLESLCTRLRLDSARSLPEGARDQWFAATKAGRPAGWLHLVTSESAENGRAIWILESERTAPSLHETFRARFTRNASLTPIDATWLKTEGEETSGGKWSFGPLEVSSLLTAADGMTHDAIWGLKEKVNWQRPCDGRRILLAVAVKQAERVSHAREPAMKYEFSLAAGAAPGGEVTLAFAAEERIEVGGKPTATRRYELRDATGAAVQEYWLRDETGAERIRIGEVTFERTTEEKATGKELK